MRNKIGAELSVNVIIIAVLALLVLVMVTAIFSSEFHKFVVGLRSIRECPKDRAILVDKVQDCKNWINMHPTYIEEPNNQKTVKYCCYTK